MSFTITDPRRPDDPLVWVNPSFSRLTGWLAGRGRRAQLPVAAGRRTPTGPWWTGLPPALRRRQPVTEVLLNYRRDGTAFWNEVSISPVYDGAGELVNFVGVQTDVTERVVVEQERRAALAEAEEARNQLRLLAEATTQMTGALDVLDACTRLARSLVPGLADLCAVDVLDRPGGVPRSGCAVAARDAADEAQLRELADAARVPPGHRQPHRRWCWPAATRCSPGELPERGTDQFPDDPRGRPRCTTGCGCGR